MSYNSKYKGEEVEGLLESIGNKVDKVDGKQLSTEDFTTLLKQKLDGLSNYDDTEIQEAVSKLRTALDTLVSGDTTTAIKTFNEVIAFLDGISDTEDLSGIISSIEQQISAKQDEITDLQTIREGAAKGATAIQSHQDISGKLDKTEAASTYLSKTEASSTYLGKTAKAADATKADSATKATQDGNGNNIVNTYATKNELNGKGTYSKPSTGIPKSDLASAVQTSLGKADTALQSYTEQYKGTVTGVKVNGSTKTPSSGTVDIGNVVTGVKINGSTKSPSSGTVDLGTVITAHQDISGKQDKLVSGTNIKTINGQSLLGGGNITISEGGGSSSGGSGAYAEVNHGTSDTTFTLTPNTFHVWDEVASLDLLFADEQAGVANEYLFQFTSGATATTLTLPDVKWANDSAPTIAENMIYQVSVLKGLASVLEFINPKIVIIEFSIDSTTYQAEEGMTWEEWLNSKYNTDVFYPDGYGYVSHPNGNYFVVTLNGIYEDITNAIIKNINYTTSR